MTFLAFQNLWQQKFRLALSIIGVGLAVGLIILLNGFLDGIYAQITAYLDNMPADLVIAQDGVTNLLSATSLLPPGVGEQARGVSGIAQAMPIVSQFVIFDLHDEKIVAYMVGYDPEQGGGPWRMKDGRFPTADDEVVLDWVMAEKHGFAIGDSIQILDEDFTVVGLSDGANSWMASFFFVEKRAAERLDHIGFIFQDFGSFGIRVILGGEWRAAGSMSRGHTRCSPPATHVNPAKS